MSGKRRNSTVDQKWEVNYLKNEQLSTSLCTRIVIIFLQQLGFYIKAVKIFW